MVRKEKKLVFEGGATAILNPYPSVLGMDTPILCVTLPLLSLTSFSLTGVSESGVAQSDLPTPTTAFIASGANS